MQKGSGFRTMGAAGRAGVLPLLREPWESSGSKARGIFGQVADTAKETRHEDDDRCVCCRNGPGAV